MITKSAKVWLGGAGGITLPITISQYDTGWEFAFSIYNGSVLYNPGVAVAVTLEGDKPDGTAFSIPGTFADGVASFDGTSSVSAAAGTVACELRVSVSGETVGTANFAIIVEEAPLAQHVTSEDNFSAMQALLDEVSQDAAAAAQAAGTAAQTVLDQAPTMVSNWLADHVDPETGYVIDTSLTVAGAAADAKTTGDELTDLKSSSNKGNYLLRPQNLLNGYYDDQGVYASSGWQVCNKFPIMIEIGDKLITEQSSLYMGWYLFDDNGNIVENGYNYLIKYQIANATHTFTHAGTLYINISNGANYAGSTSIVPSDMTAYIKIVNTYAERIAEEVSECQTELSDITGYFEKSTNLFDKTAITSGFVDTNNGTIYADANYFTSDFIPIVIGEDYSFPVPVSLYGETAAKRVPIFNSSKTNIGYITGTLSNGIVTVNITLGAVGLTVTSSDMKYLRFTNAVNEIDSTMAVESDTYPNRYRAYGSKWLSKDFILNDTQRIEVALIAGSSSLSGKKIAYNGDSIAESRLTPGNTYNGGAYPKMIADLTGGTYENRAHGGGILASQAGDGGSAPARCVVSDVTNMANDADLICFEGGINDYWRHVPLGSYVESDYSSTLDTTTLCGALESIFRQAKAKWIGKPIVFVITHKIKNTVYVAGGAGYTFAEAYEKMVGICRKYAIPYYDAFMESGLNAYDDVQNTNFLTSNPSGTPDGCHPNAQGYEKYYVPQLIALFESVMPRISES